MWSPGMWSRRSRQLVLHRFTELYASRDHKGNFFWNRAHDSKLYFQVMPPPSGDFGFDMHLRAFPATADDWEAKGRALLRDAQHV